MILLAAALAAALAACTLSIVLARRWFVVVTVMGPSMEPTLRPGDQVLVWRRSPAALHVGDIVVFRVPGGSSWPQVGSATAGQQWMIKRVAALPGCVVPDSVRSAVGGADIVPPEMFIVLGDGTRSGDSRQWGFIPTALTLGPVFRKLPGSRHNST